MTVAKLCEKTGSFEGALRGHPLLFHGKQIERRVGHLQGEFASDCQSCPAQEQIVEMFDGFVADQEKEFALGKAGLRHRRVRFGGDEAGYDLGLCAIASEQLG